MWVKPVFSGGTRVGTLISKFEDNYRDIDIKHITVFHCDRTKCNDKDDLTSLTTIDAKYLYAGEGCYDADAKAERVCEGSDRDGNGCVLKCMTHSFRYGEQRRGAPPSSNHDEGVVDPDSC